MHNESPPVSVAPPPLIPSADVCDELGISPSTLSRWAATGRIAVALKAPGLRGGMFFTRDEIDRAKEATA